MDILLVHDDEPANRAAKQVIETYVPNVTTAEQNIRGELRKDYGLVLDVTPIGKADNPIGVVENILLHMHMENPPEVHTFSKVGTFLVDALTVVRDYKGET